MIDELHACGFGVKRGLCKDGDFESGIPRAFKRI